MLKNYIKIAFRNILKKRVFSFINVLGLSIGLAACLMIITFVLHELSFDKFHTKGERIHRIHFTYQAEGGLTEVAKVPFPIKPILLERYPEVEDVARFFNNNASNSYPILQYGENKFSEEKFFFADPNIFEVFDFKLKSGNPETALANHESVVITQRVATKYFGNEDPLGKTIRYQNNTDLTVTGVLEANPTSSHLTFDFIAPINLQRFLWMNGPGNNGYDFEQDWNWAGAWVYVLLKEGTDEKVFEQKIQAIANEFINEPGENKYALTTEALLDIHLYSNVDRGVNTSGSIEQVYGFIGIAILLLIIACINFMNLATAQSAQRAKEVGLRKAMGASRSSLVLQFLGESLIIVLCATVLAGLLTELLMPSFNQMTGKNLSIEYFENPFWLVSIIGGAVLIGIAAGSYPAFFLSKFQPVKTLKGRPEKEKQGTFSIRQLLVIIQFSLSTLLIIGILTISAQLDFIRNKELGFNKEQIIVLKNGNQLNNLFDVYKNELLRDHRVIAVSQGHVPGRSNWSQTFTIAGIEGTTRMGIKHVDENFIPMYDLEVVSGRGFTNSKSDSTEAIMLNEAAVRLLGWTNEEAVGQSMSYVGGNDNQTKFDTKVVGVLKDAHFSSLHREISPAVFKLSYWGDVAIKLKLEEFNDYQEVLALAETSWNVVLPDWPFEYSFLDEDINALYTSEKKLSTTISYAAGLAIIIACLGLFGLVLFTIEQRTKEIGIRKVLGATEAAILKMVSIYFLKIVLIAALVSIPIGFYAGTLWLESFAYRIDLGLGIYVNAVIASVGIALITVSYHVLKASQQNPVESLKQE